MFEDIIFNSKINSSKKNIYLQINIQNMKKFTLSIICILITLPLIAQESLFNGNDLDGWNIHGTELWYVDKGLLICESGPDKGYGYLSTTKHYDDFDLTLEFKQEANGNSGVFFRSTVNGNKDRGWQVEVAPPGLFTGGIYESYGRGWLIKPLDGKDSSLKMGDWNKLTIKVYEDSVTTFLNGKQMITYSDEKIGDADGRIALQIHDGGGIKVKWKNIRIHEFKKSDLGIKF